MQRDIETKLDVQKVMVRMLAFNDPERGDSLWRVVEVPKGKWDAADELGRLGLVFHYGQNDFQPQQKSCSVSMADVIFLPTFAGETPVLTMHLVVGVGFKPITQEEFIELENMDRRDRSFSALVRGNRHTA